MNLIPAIASYGSTLSWSSIVLVRHHLLQKGLGFMCMRMCRGGRGKSQEPLPAHERPVRPAQQERQGVLCSSTSWVTCCNTLLVMLARWLHAGISFKECVLNLGTYRIFACRSASGSQHFKHHAAMLTTSFLVHRLITSFHMKKCCALHLVLP